MNIGLGLFFLFSFLYFNLLFYFINLQQMSASATKEFLF